MTDPVFIHPIPEPVAVGDRFRLTGAEAKHASVKRLEAVSYTHLTLPTSDLV